MDNCSTNNKGSRIISPYVRINKIEFHSKWSLNYTRISEKSNVIHGKILVNAIYICHKDDVLKGKCDEHPQP